MIQCPVCLMQFDELDAECNREYAGQSYYFCSEDCMEQFDYNPELYAKPLDAKPKTRQSAQ